jgi:hypothetical protein
LISLGIYFSSSIALIVVLWNTSCHSWTNLNFLLPLSKTLSPFDVIPLGKPFFFNWQGRLCKLGLMKKATIYPTYWLKGSHERCKC